MVNRKTSDHGIELTQTKGKTNSSHESTVKSPEELMAKTLNSFVEEYKENYSKNDDRGRHDQLVSSTIKIFNENYDSLFTSDASMADKIEAKKMKDFLTPNQLYGLAQALDDRMSKDLGKGIGEKIKEKSHMVQTEDFKEVKDSCLDHICSITKEMGNNQKKDMGFRESIWNKLGDTMSYLGADAFAQFCHKQSNFYKLQRSEKKMTHTKKLEEERSKATSPTR